MTTNLFFLTFFLAINIAQGRAKGPCATCVWPTRGQGQHRQSVASAAGPTSLTTKPLWEFKAGARVISQAVVNDAGEMFFGSGDKKVYGITADGSLKWEFVTGGEVIGTGALTNDGSLYIGSWDKHMYSLDSASGELNWKVKLGHVVSSSPVIGKSGNIYVGSGDTHLYALSPRGSVIWRFKTAKSVYSSPALSNDGRTVFVGSWDSHLYAVDASTGAEIWRYSTEGSIDSSPTVSSDGSVVYVGSWDGFVYAIDTATGALRWKYSTGSEGVVASPTIGQDGTIFIGSWNKAVIAINPEGTLRWSRDVGAVVEGTATVDSDGNVFIGCWDGDLLVLRGHDGHILARENFQETISSAPTIDERGVLVFADEDGRVRAYAPASFSPNARKRRPNQRSSMAAPAFDAGADGVVEVEVAPSGAVRASSPATTTHNAHTAHASSASSAWSSFRGGALNGQSALAGPMSNAQGKLLGIDWVLQKGSAFSSSVISDGAGMLFSGNSDGHLYAVEAKTGRLVWEAETNGAIVSTAALSPDKQTLYVGSWDQHLYAFATASGAVRWKFLTNDPVSSSPAVRTTDGIVFVGSGDAHMYAVDILGQEIWKFKAEGAVYSSASLSPDQTLVAFGSWDFHLYVLSAQDGKLLWRFKTEDKIDSSPAFGADGSVYVGSWDGHVYRISALGEKLWQTKIKNGAGIVSSPTLGNGAVYLGTWDAVVVALDSVTGEVRWEQEVDSEIEGGVTLDAAGRLYAGTVGGHVYVLDSADGRVIESTNLNSPQLDEFDQVAISSTATVGRGERLYVGTGDGRLVALSARRRGLCEATQCPRATKSIDAKNSGNSAYAVPRLPHGTVASAESHPGLIRWSRNFEDGLVSTASVGAGGRTIYQCTQSGKVVALDAQTGAVQWEFKTGTTIVASPLIGADGVIYVTSWDSYLYALWPTGDLKWKYKTSAALSSSPKMSNAEDGIVYFGGGAKEVIAISAMGHIKWRMKTDGAVYSTPALSDNGVLYVGSLDQKLYAVDMETGAKLWATDLGSRLESSPTIGPQGTIYVGSFTGSVFALRPADGSVEWEVKTGPHAIISSPSVSKTSGVIYIGSKNKAIHAIYPNGDKLWDLQLSENIDSTGLIDRDGVVCFGGSRGNMYAVDGVTGEIKWVFRTEKPLFAAPTLLRDHAMLVATERGMLYVLDQ